MGVDGPALEVDLALAQEGVHDEVRGLLDVIEAAGVSRKRHPDALRAHLLLKEIPLVKEHYKGDVLKVLVVDNLLEKVEALVHSENHRYVYIFRVIINI